MKLERSQRRGAHPALCSMHCCCCCCKSCLFRFASHCLSFVEVRRRLFVPDFPPYPRDKRKPASIFKKETRQRHHHHHVRPNCCCTASCLRCAAIDLRETRYCRTVCRSSYFTSPTAPNLFPYFSIGLFGFSHAFLSTRFVKVALSEWC